MNTPIQVLLTVGVGGGEEQSQILQNKAVAQKSKEYHYWWCR
jgi:hypothetical protein